MSSKDLKVAGILSLAWMIVAGAESVGSAQPGAAHPSVQPARGAWISWRKDDEDLLELRRVNLSVNPLGPAIGLYSASLAVAVSQHLALRGDFSTFDMDDDVQFGDNDPNDSNFTEVGVGLTFYPRHTFQGLFIEPGVITRRFGGDSTLTGPQLLVGWHWSFSNGFNVAAAIGGVLDLDMEGESENPLNGTFRVGYAF